MPAGWRRRSHVGRWGPRCPERFQKIACGAWVTRRARLANARGAIAPPGRVAEEAHPPTRARPRRAHRHTEAREGRSPSKWRWQAGSALRVRRASTQPHQAQDRTPRVPRQRVSRPQTVAASRGQPRRPASPSPLRLCPDRRAWQPRVDRQRAPRGPPLRHAGGHRARRRPRADGARTVPRRSSPRPVPGRARHSRPARYGPPRPLR